MEKHALVLSGGGARGAYQIGVWKALRELNIPIDIVTGSSVGALNGSLIAQDRYDDAVALWEAMETHMVFDVKPGKTAPKFNTGTSGLEKIIKEYGDEEAIRNSKVDYGLVMVQMPEMKPYYLFAKDIEEGHLHECILASASFFPALEAVEIDGKRFVDGGYADVMPVQMAVDRGADHVIAVYLDGLGVLRKSRLRDARNRTKSLHIIKSEWDLGSVLDFDVDNNKRIMKLGYLDAMKEFGVYDGIRYTFEKDCFSRHRLLGADAAADAMGLDPTVIYKEETLMQQLQLVIANLPIADYPVMKLEDLGDHLTSSSLVIHIARDLQKKEEDSIFMKQPAYKMFLNEVKAANFLIMSNLV